MKEKKFPSRKTRQTGKRKSSFFPRRGRQPGQRISTPKKEKEGVLSSRGGEKDPRPQGKAEKERNADSLRKIKNGTLSKEICNVKKNCASCGKKKK